MFQKITTLFLSILILCGISFADDFPYQEKVDEIKIDFEMDHQVFDEEGLFVVYQKDFFPEDYCLGQDIDYKTNKDTNFEYYCYFSYKGKHRVNIIYRVNVFVPSNIEISDNEEPLYEIQEFKGATGDETAKVNVNQLFDVSYNQVALKRFKIYVEVEKIDSENLAPKVTIKNMKFTYLTQVNPRYDDFFEVHILSNRYDYHPGDELTLSLSKSFYYGYPSQWVDIYLVFYNFKNCYFFPDMTTEIQKINLFLPQYTMFRKERIELGTINIDDLNPKYGMNMFYIGVAPEGTLDFLNEDLGEMAILYSD